MTTSRRTMMIGCCAAITEMAGGRIRDIVIGPETSAATRDIFVLVFLRGGCDGLSFVAPYDDINYINNRPSLKLNAPGSSTNAAYALPSTINASVPFGLHPKAGGLKELYDQRKLAFVHACGLTNGTRSHFDAMDYMERGTPSSKSTSTGWITRHLASIGASGNLPAVASSATLPASLLNSPSAVAMNDSNFKLNGHWKYSSQQRAALSAFYADSSPLETVGRSTLALMDAIATKNLGTYIPAPGVEYPSEWYASGFSSSLKLVAQLIKADLNVQVATLDYGGWDTHEGQAYALPNLINGLARGLAAFYNDLAPYHSRLTMVVMSEFGRRLRENRSGGTDHGYGNLMLVLGGNVNGGKIYGQWPGLEPSALDKQVDLAITTDYRRVLSEIIVRRLANGKLGRVFPNYSPYAPLGVVNGVDLPIDYTTGLHTVNLPMVRR